MRLALSRHPRRTTLAGWCIWWAMLLLATVVLRFARDEIAQVHAALTLLLVVLGGSIAGGRALGFTLAIVSFGLIDYYFQPPYDLISVDKPLDGVVLAAFLATAGVATDLLARARAEAEQARQRANEVEGLSRLGATTLRYAEPAEALGAIATLVRETIHADCTILHWDGSPEFPNVGSVTGEERRALERATECACPVSLTVRGECLTHDYPAFAADNAPPLVATLLAIPLRAEHRTLGVLVVRGTPRLALDAPRRRFLAALAYYAALGVERLRLVREAAHSQALREADRAKNQILASVSHDLRTPLTTIKLLAQGAQARGEPAASGIVEQADRLARMVSDLLELSRLRAGGFDVTPELNAAEDLVGAALRQAEGVLDGKRIVAHVDFDSPMLLGHFDFVHTLRIIGNLLDNALRFTPCGGVVDLLAEREGNQLVFSVADRGVGVEPAERDRIFEAFYRPSGSPPDTGHAGLGLSIARTLAELQGGTLTYAPRDGGGSEFILRLPAADIDDEAEER